MIHILKHPFEFNGQSVSELVLPDFMKPKYRLAIARLGKLAKDCGVADLHERQEDDELKVEDLTDEELIALAEFDLKSTIIMLETYCQGLPPGAAEEVSDDDAKVMAEYVSTLISQDQKRYKAEEPVSRKNPIRARRSGKS